MFATSRCAGGQLRSLVVLTSHRSARSRLLSTTALQRGSLLANRTDQYGLRASTFRSFWWSSSKTPAVETSPPSTPVEQLKNNDAVPEASEQPPAETASVVESSAVLEAPQEAASTLTGAADSASGSVSAVADAASNLPTPMQYGDLAQLGLATWTPAGICRWGMEIVHVTSGLPWFWTIIVSTLLSRVVLFPFSVIALRNSAKLIPYQPQLNALREQMNASRGNQLLMQKALLQQKKLYEKIGVSIGSMAIMPFIQLPVTLGMFFGVKSMCDLPVEQLKWSGLSFLPDLTVADPTMTLPILAAVAMNFQLSLGLRDMTPAPHMPHLINLFRVLTTASVFLMMNLPSGVLVYIVTSIVGIMAQTAILRVPAVRRVLGIPIIPKTQTLKPASMRESLAYAKKWWEQQKREAELKAKASQRR